MRISGVLCRANLLIESSRNRRRLHFHTTLIGGRELRLPLLNSEGRGFMPKLTFMPHETICPEGVVIEADADETILNSALAHNIDIEHACEKSCACTTCHIIVREGFDSLEEAEENEEDYLDKAWGLEPESRLSCQAKVGTRDLVIEIPKYTINMVSENH